MRRMTVSLIATAAILLFGGFLLWHFLVAPRLAVPTPPVTTPPPAEEPAAEPPAPMHGALNLYLGAPERLPAGAARVELTLNEARLSGADGAEAVAFTGAQRVMLQAGVVEKVLSERVPNGRWTRLTLRFSPAAEVAYADGRSAAALVQRREAVLEFDVDLPVSRTLAMFAAAPLEAEAFLASDTLTLNVSSSPREAETFVLGGFLLDPRGRGDIWSIVDPTLATVVKEDIGLDITRKGTGSAGFVPAADATPSP